MKFDSRIKGSVTQALLKSLFEGSGYMIVPLGVEEVIRELTILDSDAYKNLKLPKNLRCIPDFFVANDEMSETWLVELKFRKQWNDDVRKSLSSQLRNQAEHWGPFHLLLFLGESCKKYDYKPSGWFGVARLDYRESELVLLKNNDSVRCKWKDVKWDDLYRIQDVFDKINAKENWQEGVLSKVQFILNQLNSIDAIE